MKETAHRLAVAQLIVKANGLFGLQDVDGNVSLFQHLESLRAHLESLIYSL